MILEERFAVEQDIMPGVEVAVIDLKNRSVLVSVAVNGTVTRQLFADELDYENGAALLIEPGLLFSRRLSLLTDGTGALDRLTGAIRSASVAVIVLTAGAFPQQREIEEARCLVGDLYLTRLR